MKIALSTLMMFFLICTGCKKDAASTSVPQGMTSPEGFSPGGITPDMTEQLLKTADHIDYLFAVLPLSMNQQGQSAIYQDLRFLSSKPLTGLINGCQPLARKIYLGNGEIITEADLYFSNGCFYQVFLSNEKPIYGNYLSEEGLNYHLNLMDQAKKSMPADIRKAYNLPDVEDQ